MKVISMEVVHLYFAHDEGAYFGQVHYQLANPQKEPTEGDEFPEPPPIFDVKINASVSGTADDSYRKIEKDLLDEARRLMRIAIDKPTGQASDAP